MIAVLVECSDYDNLYGVLTVKNVSAKEVQKKINEIKNRFYDEKNYGWCIGEVFENFPKEWIWGFEPTIDVLAI